MDTVVPQWDLPGINLPTTRERGVDLPRRADLRHTLAKIVADTLKIEVIEKFLKSFGYRCWCRERSVRAWRCTSSVRDNAPNGSFFSKVHCRLIMMPYLRLIDTKINISRTPNWALSNHFTHSILIQIKIPLEALFSLVRGAFLLEAKKKIRVKSEGGKLFSQSWWCYISALHHRAH